MNKKLILAEHICKKIKEVKPTNTAAFKNVVDEYNKLATMVNDENEMPFESPFDKEKDVSCYRGCFCFTSEGSEKKDRIQSRCELYVATVSAKSKMSKKKFMEIISFLFSGVALFFIQQCSDSGKEDVDVVNVPINLKNESTFQPQQNINIINGNNNTVTNSNNLQMDK